ncbi:capsular polysaccharide export protein, LipB/KpsS family [Paracoccus seriniphilus]|uniref:capsular polysaccharide export protein, LipB/KpsS family n=1 Tax=Paracoccus seriniphilus TaxID=184748 RepID=UPI0035694925
MSHKTRRDIVHPVVTLEIPAAWFSDPVDGDRHRLFYGSILSALSELHVLVDPVRLPRGAETAPRPKGQGTISFHSYGGGDGDILRCKESYIPPYYSMDSMGYACFSHLAMHPECYREAIESQDGVTARSFVQGLAQELKQANRSKYTQPEHGRNDARGYVFVPLQVGNDTVAKGAWLKTQEALETIVTAARARGQEVVIKRHPRCRGRGVSRLLAELSGRPGVSMSDGSVLSLISGADLVVGANSGVLFEALVQGKPVISHGASDFGLATQQVRSCAELAAAVAAPSPPDGEWRDRFLFWYLTRYCVRADDVAAIRDKLEAFLDGLGTPTAPGRRARRRYVRALYRHSLINRLKRRFF